MREIVYISGTRADFGLMRRTLEAISRHSGTTLSILATGMHFSALHGETICEIEATGLPICGRVPVTLAPETGETMARAIGAMTSEFANVLAARRPDLVLLLGDRGEMLAGAIAALHLNIPIAHIHGGERSGTVDEPVRHAISKLSHLHFTATLQSGQRLIRMGEPPGNVHVTGAPGLDGLTDGDRAERSAVAAAHGFDPTRPIALFIYHPVLHEAESAGEQASVILDALFESGCQILALLPNADAGSGRIRAALQTAAGRAGYSLVTHLPRERLLDAMAVADMMVGNSSAAIIESASFGTPAINVGSRQNLRERNANVTDVPAEGTAVLKAIATALAHGRFPRQNIYGDGRTAGRIAELVATLPLDMAWKGKINAY